MINVLFMIDKDPLMHWILYDKDAVDNKLGLLLMYSLNTSDMNHNVSQVLNSSMIFVFVKTVLSCIDELLNIDGSDVINSSLTDKV